MESDLIQALLDAISAGDDEAAERTAQAMTGQTRLVPALGPLLADEDTDRRWWAVRSLALTGGAAAMRLLAERLADEDVATRCAAALALGQLGATEAIPALVARLADPNGWVRDSAGDALALIGEPAVAALAQALGDAREGVRVRAAGALRRVMAAAFAQGVPTGAEFGPVYGPAVGTLFRALNDPNRLVRHNAYETLDRLGLLETILVQ